MPTTDCDLIKEILSDNRWWNVIDIMKRGKPGCLNWAVRSRISDLNQKKGIVIDSRMGGNGCAEYKLVPADGDQGLLF